MPKFAIFLVLGLAGCEISDAAQPTSIAAGDVQGWRTSAGKRPSRAEYAAVVAACQDGTLVRVRGKALDACLADLGFRRK